MSYDKQIIYYYFEMKGLHRMFHGHCTNLTHIAKNPPFFLQYVSYCHTYKYKHCSGSKLLIFSKTQCVQIDLVMTWGENFCDVHYTLSHSHSPYRDRASKSVSPSWHWLIAVISHEWSWSRVRSETSRTSQSEWGLGFRRISWYYQSNFDLYLK